MSLVRKAIVEVARCSRNIELGGSPAFWIMRIERWANEIDTARAVLTVKLRELRQLQEPATKEQA